MHLGSNRRISAAAAFSKLIALPVRIVSAAVETRELPAKRELPSAASLRNSLDFASQSHFRDRF
ncbi:MAG: hypothetical protein A3A44_01790 [Candidatus Sungbacteria bacterium RIFCSPLOWO2_01_FULL_60_25]|uniref:Uncharacterized protein n=1 Tax=Candidatus Sungbacteria bacterium RIFCSPLOWO2_01_FULL_60_25 TaxID=1802281 RepID=A0A1G2LAU9_9BACT|nr:MAG: hypothetical protein A3A44_01790 [Candidatus Sungbacteria bacterium RIFCSPLOWO2_01_FULL_60_25]